MNEASEWRLAVARRIAPVYSRYPQVQAVALYGSAARGEADRYSDVEIKVFWAEEPSDDARKAAVEQAGGVLGRFWGYEPKFGDWAEEYLLAGLKIDVSHATVAQTEQWIGDVVEHADTALMKQDLVSLVRYCVPLYGQRLVEEWRARVDAYPDHLARAMVKQYLTFGPAGNLDMLAARGDLLPLYEALCLVEKNLLLVLMALNRLYLPHAGFKWTDRLAAQMRLATPNLPARLKRVFLADPPDSVRELRELVEETFDLVEKQMPEIDTAEAREWFRQGRVPIDRAPEGLLEDRGLSNSVLKREDAR